MKQLIRLIKLIKWFPSLKDFNDYVDEIIKEDLEASYYEEKDEEDRPNASD